MDSSGTPGGPEVVAHQYGTRCGKAICAQGGLAPQNSLNCLRGTANSLKSMLRAIPCFVRKWQRNLCTVLA